MTRWLLTCAGIALGSAIMAAAEPPTLVGTWKVLEYQDDGGDQRGRLGMTKAADSKFAKLVFTKDECWVVRADGKRDVIRGLTNNGWKRYALKPAQGFHEISITAFDGASGGEAEIHYPGIVKIDQGKLYLCWNETGIDPGSNKGKKVPSKFESDGEMNLFVAERLSDQPEDKPKQTNAIAKK